MGEDQRYGTVSRTQIRNVDNPTLCSASIPIAAGKVRQNHDIDPIAKTLRPLYQLEVPKSHVVDSLFFQSFFGSFASSDTFSPREDRFF